MLNHLPMSCGERFICLVHDLERHDRAMKRKSDNGKDSRRIDVAPTDHDFGR